jgi:DNA-binding Xre family transcriptional regulator
MRTKKTRMYRLRVKEIAESKGISRTKLSHLAEMQYETINGMWRNPQRDVSLSTLLKLAHALQVAVSELYEVLPDE